AQPRWVKESVSFRKSTPLVAAPGGLDGASTASHWSLAQRFRSMTHRHMKMG
ncbi:hypothetical protein NPIL_148411, partial [Nephila pilipes]